MEKPKRQFIYQIKKLLKEQGGIMDELKNDEFLFDDRELEDLTDEEIELSEEEQKELEKEIDIYFNENEIEYE